MGAAVVEVYVLRSPNRASAGTLVQTLLTVQTFALTIAALLWKWGRPAGTGQLALTDAATQLAEQVRALWEREGAARRLTTANGPDTQRRMYRRADEDIPDNEPLPRTKAQLGL